MGSTPTAGSTPAGTRLEEALNRARIGPGRSPRTIYRPGSPVGPFHGNETPRRKTRERIAPLRQRSRSDRSCEGSGEVPERPNGPDCKSGGFTFGGSNPPLPTTAPCRCPPPSRRPSRAPLPGRDELALTGRPRPLRAADSIQVGGRSSMVEPQPSKLMAWVRFPSPAPAFLARPAHTEPPPAGPGGCCSSVVEHFLGKEEAMGSSPISSSNTSRSTQQPSREAPAGAPTNQTNRAAAQSTTTETDG